MLENRRAADGLGQMTLAGPGRSKEEDVLALSDEASGGEFVDERAIHLLVEFEIEAGQRSIRIAKASQLRTALEEPVLPSQQLIGYESRDDVQRHHFLCLSLP